MGFSSFGNLVYLKFGLTLLYRFFEETRRQDAVLVSGGIPFLPILSLTWFGKLMN